MKMPTMKNANNENANNEMGNNENPTMKMVVAFKTAVECLKFLKNGQNCP